MRKTAYWRWVNLRRALIIRRYSPNSSFAIVLGAVP